MLFRSFYHKRIDELVRYSRGGVIRSLLLEICVDLVIQTNGELCSANLHIERIYGGYNDNGDNGCKDIEYKNDK